MTVAEALRYWPIPASEARLLLASASGWSRATLAAHPEADLDDQVVAKFRAAAQRRADGEPIAYLLGEKDFYGISLRVTPDVLIPRPETELLVEFALGHVPRGGALLDLGSGSGAIALAVKHERPDVTVTAVEQSVASLEVARANAKRLGLEVELLEGDWCEPVTGRRFDAVVSNPPYVAEGDPHLSQGDLRFEPRAALVGGGDGFEALRVIAAGGSRHLHKGGWLALEHGQGQDAEVRRLLGTAGFESVASRSDLAGIARITFGKYNLE